MNRLWLQIDIAQAGAELRATARGSRDEEPQPHLLGPQLPPEAVGQFREWVKSGEGLQEILLQLGAVGTGGTP